VGNGELQWPEKGEGLLAASSRTQSSGWRGSSLGWSIAEGGRERFVRGQLASPMLDRKTVQ
jgi:hypothetical protein